MSNPLENPGAWFAAQPLAFHERWMRMALAEARAAAEEGEVPAGCVVIRLAEDGTTSLVGKAHNGTEALHDPTAHAEVLAITQAAAAVGDWRLNDCALYVTKEPCPMCGGAIVLGRPSFVSWAADDPKRGAHTVFHIFEHPGINHHPHILPRVCEAECLEVLQEFFQKRRAKNDGEKP